MKPLKSVLNKNWYHVCRRYAAAATVALRWTAPRHTPNPSPLPSTPDTTHPKAGHLAPTPTIALPPAHKRPYCPYTRTPGKRVDRF